MRLDTGSMDQSHAPSGSSATGGWRLSVYLHLSSFQWIGMDTFTTSLLLYVKVLLIEARDSVPRLVAYSDNLAPRDKIWPSIGPDQPLN